MQPSMRTLVVAAAAAWSLALAFAAWRMVDSQQVNEGQARFEFRVREIANELRGRMYDYEQVLRGTVGLLAASREVTADEWRTYVTTLQLDSSYPGIQAIAYAPYVRKGNAASAPVRFIEPGDRGNERALGFDLLQEAERRSAIERARDTGEGVLTGRVTLLSEQAGARPPGFVLLLPVYRGDIPDSLERRRERFAAVVYAAFRATDLFRGTIGQPSGLHLRLFDVTEPQPQLLYEDDRDEGRPRFHLAEPITVRGRTWRLEAKSRPALETLLAGDRARLVLAAGIALSALFTALIWSFVNTRARASELARAMVAAAEERDRYRSAVDLHGDVILMVDVARMRFVYVNEGACRSLGYRREELLGQSAAMVFADRDEQQLARQYEQHATTGEVSEVERGSFRRKDGSLLPVEISRQFLQTAAGGRFVLGVARDITERLRAEQSLRESEGRLALALESSGLALFDWDLQSNLVHLGGEWRLMLGGEAVATVTPVQKLEQLVHPDDLPAVRAQVRRLLAGEVDGYRVEHRVRTLDGQWKWIESVAKVSGRGPSGRAVRVTGTNADISERKAIAEMKNAFIAAVSHELRTPLTGIVSSLDLLGDGSAGELPEQARQFVKIASANSERLQALIDDILDLERVETGRLRLEIRPLAVSELLRKAATLNAAYADRYKTRIVSDSPGSLQVMADEDRLVQVLTNLISNAAKHSPPGGEIRLAAFARDDRVILSVADQGSGIADEFKARIFGKFEQADGAKGGTGLGLAITKALVEKMGGEIRFESALGKGATFFVDLSAG